MIRIDAGRDIALVANEHANGDRAFVFFVGKPMRGHDAAFGDVQDAVAHALFKRRSGPKNTPTVRFGDGVKLQTLLNGKANPSAAFGDPHNDKMPMKPGILWAVQP